MSSIGPTEIPPEVGGESRVIEKPRTERVRPMSRSDLPRVTELYRRVFGNTGSNSRDFLERVFFEPPWRDASLPSLTYEDQSGQIIGCLGVMPRQMKFHGEAIRAAVGHHFMIDPFRRDARAAVELTRKFLRGSQDLSLAEGDESTRRIWEFLGGQVCLLYSFCWTRPLRPARYALSVLNRRGLPPAAGLPLKPVCQAVDATLQIVPLHGFRIQQPRVLGDDLDTVTMLAFLSAFANGRSLQPVYDFNSLDWLIDVLQTKRHRGTLHKVAVRTESGRPLGWYLYFLGTNGVAEVVQVGGNTDNMREVLNHLFYHAWRRGAVAATGPMDSNLCGVLSENDCMFNRPYNSWMLAHSWDEKIINAVNAGDAFLSRLEGEWWITS